MVIREPIKRLCEILKGGWVTSCRTLLLKVWLLATALASLESVLEVQKLRP